MKRRRPVRYSNRNRRWGPRQNTFALTLKSALILVALMAAGVVYLLLVQSRSSVQDEIRREEARRIALQEQLRRETSAWTAMRTPRELTRTLAAHGVSMSQPRASQRVAMGSVPSGPGGARGSYASNR